MAARRNTAAVAEKPPRKRRVNQTQALVGVVIKREEDRQGPPPKFLDPQWMRRFYAGILAGGTDYMVAQSLGVSRSTFYNWCAKGREARTDAKMGAEYPEYVEFLDVLEQAKARVTVQLEAVVSVQKPETWLARNMPEKWSDRAEDKPPPGAMHFTFNIIAASGGIPLGTGENPSEEDGSASSE